MKEIQRINKKVLDHLIAIKKNNASFKFVPRKINNKNRLDQGYWFIGNDHYLQISFWDGSDWKEKIHNIGFSINKDKQCYIDLSAQDSTDKANFLSNLSKVLGGFIKDGKKSRWYKPIDHGDYIQTLDYFINNLKPIIDKELINKKPVGISILNSSADKRMNNVIARRNNQIEYGKTNKISRIVWNTNNWKSPSGLSGCPLNDFKAKYGYGHEEWLFDKSKIIDGYHYAFLQPLNLETDEHVGNTYNISLYTSDLTNKKYFVGEIKDAESISGAESNRIFKLYNKMGWYDEMVNDLKRVNADYQTFKNVEPEWFMNIRFKINDADLCNELVLISESDINITAPRYKLLPKVRSIEFETQVEVETDQGSLKNTKKRKRVTHAETEFDPYHDKMQNQIFKLLQSCPEYNSKMVFIEKGRVDIKAMTIDEQWHFYELKTDSPKLSIRKALGQILEYAYYPIYKKAEKLFIVSDSKPTQDDINYMNHIRSITGLEIYYRYYSFDNNSLSNEF